MEQEPQSIVHWVGRVKNIIQHWKLWEIENNEHRILNIEYKEYKYNIRIEYKVYVIIIVYQTVYIIRIE